MVGGRTKLSEDLATFSTLHPNVLIATPKRLLEVISSSRVVLKRHWFDLLVLDEADRLLDANFHADLQKILEILLIGCCEGIGGVVGGGECIHKVGERLREHLEEGIADRISNYNHTR